MVPSQNDEALGDYIGAMFGVPSSPPVSLGSLLRTPSHQALQCTWVDAPDRFSAFTAALLMYQLFHQLPEGRLRTVLRRRGLMLLMD